jgi:hypothetical protein
MSASALAINNSLLLSNMNNSGLASTIVGKNTRGFSSNSGRDKNVFNSGSTFQSQSQDLVTEQYLRGSIAETNSTREIHLPLLIAANSGIQLPMGSSRGQAQQNITESIGRYGALGADNNTDSLAASNIWGVPANNELSHIRIEQSILEEEDDL